MISYGDACRAVGQTLDGLEPPRGSLEVFVENSLGRYLSGPRVCQYDSPQFDQSAMDGVAFRYDSARDHYRLIGTIAAGDPPATIAPAPHECVRIMTGAPLPVTADTVEMIENVTIVEDRVRFKTHPTKGKHIRFRGENMKEGEPLYAAGKPITAGVIAGLVSQGFRYIEVKRPLRVGIASTGNEIVDLHQPLEPGRIYNSNSPSIAARLRSRAVEATMLERLPDDLAKSRKFLAHNADLDMLILSGGVSMGSFDFIPEAARQAGFREVFHKVRMKPGKPIWFGAHGSGCLLFGLPGNPVSALVGTLLFVEPALRARLGGSFTPPRWALARAGTRIENLSGLTVFLGACYHGHETTPLVRPVQTSGSGDIARFSNFETLIRVPPRSSFAEGDTIQVLLPFPS